MQRVLVVLLAGLLGACLVAAVLADKISCLWLIPISLFPLRWRSSSLFGHILLIVFGLALAGLPACGLLWMAKQESSSSARCFDLARLEKIDQPLPALGRIQLCGSVYFAGRERVYTRDYGWVQPIYSRRHPRFPGNGGPDQPPSFFLTLDRDPMLRLAHRFLPPVPKQEIRDCVYVRQLRTGFFQEQPGDLLVLPCLARAAGLSLCGAALFGLGLSLLIANLGHQRRARRRNRWERPLGS